ncbi:hypothetical protein V6Z11_D13G001900 [Gossypium hirsutum]
MTVLGHSRRQNAKSQVAESPEKRGRPFAILVKWR